MPSHNTHNSRICRLCPCWRSIECHWSLFGNIRRTSCVSCQRPVSLPTDCASRELIQTWGHGRARRARTGPTERTPAPEATKTGIFFLLSAGGLKVVMVMGKHL